MTVWPSACGQGSLFVRDDIICFGHIHGWASPQLSLLFRPICIHGHWSHYQHPLSVPPILGAFCSPNAWEMKKKKYFLSKMSNGYGTRIWIMSTWKGWTFIELAWRHGNGDVFFSVHFFFRGKNITRSYCEAWYKMHKNIGETRWNSRYFKSRNKRYRTGKNITKNLPKNILPFHSEENYLLYVFS